MTWRQDRCATFHTDNCRSCTTSTPSTSGHTVAHSACLCFSTSLKPCSLHAITACNASTLTCRSTSVQDVAVLLRCSSPAAAEQVLAICTGTTGGSKGHSKQQHQVCYHGVQDPGTCVYRRVRSKSQQRVVMEVQGRALGCPNKHQQQPMGRTAGWTRFL